MTSFAGPDALTPKGSGRRATCQGTGGLWSASSCCGLLWCGSPQFRLLGGHLHVRVGKLAGGSRDRTGKVRQACLVGGACCHLMSRAASPMVPGGPRLAAQAIAKLKGCKLPREASPWCLAHLFRARSDPIRGPNSSGRPGGRTGIPSLLPRMAIRAFACRQGNATGGRTRFEGVVCHCRFSMCSCLLTLLLCHVLHVGLIICGVGS